MCVRVCVRVCVCVCVCVGIACDITTLISSLVIIEPLQIERLNNEKEWEPRVHVCVTLRAPVLEGRLMSVCVLHQFQMSSRNVILHADASDLTIKGKVLRGDLLKKYL